MKKDIKVIDASFESYYCVFLTLSCTLSCEYCVQKISCPAVAAAKYPVRRGADWVEALNSLANRRKKRFLRRAKRKKISITGGEPTLHPDFAFIVNNLDRDWAITVTSNLFSPFYRNNSSIKSISRRSGLKFNFSHHFLYTPVDKFIDNLKRVKDGGLYVHIIFIVAHPDHIDDVKRYRDKLLKAHPLVKLQRFTGYYKNTLYPVENGYDIECQQQDGIRNYADYRQGFSQKNKEDMFCRMGKVLFAPNGDIYNCHYKLYTAHNDKFGNIFSKGLNISMPSDFFLCHDYGFCNPCDSEGHAFKKPGAKEAFNISF
ncbi:MAG: radical SAM protein [Candidatus Omnitrophica bacterium]|nr:radical SAM protein [Candidatus Omnitrophota bacterium]